MKKSGKNKKVEMTAMMGPDMKSPMKPKGGGKKDKKMTGKKSGKGCK